MWLPLRSIRALSAWCATPSSTTTPSAPSKPLWRYPGIDFVNVSGADRTPAIVAEIRARYPELPIIATGGPTEETILATIAAGANAITYTPPTNGQLFAKDMHRYREWFAHMDDPEEDEKASPSDTAQ